MERDNQVKVRKRDPSFGGTRSPLSMIKGLKVKSTSESTSEVLEVDKSRYNVAWRWIVISFPRLEVLSKSVRDVF